LGLWYDAQRQKNGPLTFDAWFAPRCVAAPNVALGHPVKPPREREQLFTQPSHMVVTVKPRRRKRPLWAQIRWRRHEMEDSSRGRLHCRAGRPVGGR
jgi:hypothetical protein